MVLWSGSLTHAMKLLQLGLRSQRRALLSGRAWGKGRSRTQLSPRIARKHSHNARAPGGDWGRLPLCQRAKWRMLWQQLAWARMLNRSAVSENRQTATFKNPAGFTTVAIWVKLKVKVQEIAFGWVMWWVRDEWQKNTVRNFELFYTLQLSDSQFISMKKFRRGKISPHLNDQEHKDKLTCSMDLLNTASLSLLKYPSTRLFNIWYY